MKSLAFLLSQLFAFNTQAQTLISEPQKCEQIILVWGLIKYHHPEVSRGKQNWDSVFVRLIDDSEEIKSQEVLDTYLTDFLARVGTDNLKAGSTRRDDENLFYKNYDYAWIEDTGFSDTLRESLLRLKNNTNLGDYYAVVPKLSTIISFDEETTLKDFDPDLKSHRLLTLSRFWNIIQYWDVNKYLTDTPWATVLEELIIDFLDEETSYERDRLKMLSKTNDSHFFMPSRFIYDSLFNHHPPFGCKVINDTLKVMSIYNDTLAQKNGIHLGDVIIEIEGKPVNEYVKSRFSEFFSVSNRNYLNRSTSNITLSNDVPTIQVKMLDDEGELIPKVIRLYQTYKVSNPEYLIKPDSSHWKKLSPEITYINLGQISSKTFAEAIKASKDTKGIILDLRNYPRNIGINDFSKFFYPEKKEFIRIVAPLNARPALGDADVEPALKVLGDPFKVGKKSTKYYRGKLVLLVDRSTGSMAEYFGMAIQQAPNCATIGEQTMGGVMNYTDAILP
ncbi:MAG: hypothetical protein AAF740_14330, partial [Bacteroidota bacterium]